MSFLSFFKGQRGEYLVVLQFVLFFAFILTPTWNPLATPGLLETLASARWTALALFGSVGLVLGGLGSMHIKEYLTPLPYPVDHNQLVQHGVYAWVRHPLYSSQLFAALGWTLFTLSLTHLALLAIGFLFFDYKARKEESWLTERHPDYQDYARRVSKFIPWIY
ncbi:methyltransferase family protein [Thiorhodococcus fuscus]|uniref:Methyltransferase family protein n=1 Tax=Thiorhodococcus fuscus TaxID=527200 RepID=A0ABW4Y7I6_9GAMM